MIAPPSGLIGTRGHRITSDRRWRRRTRPPSAGDQGSTPTPSCCCRVGRAAGRTAERGRRLDDTHPWAIGITRPFNQDGFGSDSRGDVDALLRRRSAAVGLALWEPNATLVRTEDLRRHPIDPRRPRGAWLRARHAEGGRPATVDQPLALVAAPAGAHTFWPESMAQQRGSAADAADAVRSGRGTARQVALGLLVRDCFAWSMLTWLLVLFTAPSRGAPDAHRVTAPTRPSCSPHSCCDGSGCTGPPDDPTSVPRPARHGRRRSGSLAAASAITGRVGEARHAAVRPLLWAGLLSVAVLVTALVDHSPDQPMTAPAVGAALLTLVLLWVVCIQVLVQQGWSAPRSGFRSADRHAWIPATPARSTCRRRAGRRADLSGAPATRPRPATGDGSGQAASDLAIVLDPVGVELDAVLDRHGRHRRVDPPRPPPRPGRTAPGAGRTVGAAPVGGARAARRRDGSRRSRPPSPAGRLAPRTTHPPPGHTPPRHAHRPDVGPAATATAGVSRRSRTLDVVGSA